MNEIAGRVRIVDVKVLSDDWYVLKKPPSTINARTAVGNARAAKPTIAATAQRCCSTTRAAARWC